MQKYLGVCIFIFYLGVVHLSCTSQTSENPSPEIPPLSNQFIQKYGRSWYFYAQVNKSGDYFRRIFIDSVSAQTVRNTGETPSNALFAMETWFGNEQSTVFIRQKQTNWQGGSFSPASPNYALSLQISCNNCHSRAASTDQTFTKPLLIKALQRNQLQIIECDMTSFNPCDLSVYQGN
jgi:hypothetical protein